MTNRNVIEYQKKISSKILTVVTIILTMVSLTNTVPTGLAAQGSFVAGLIGIEEVPPVHTNATGDASFLPTMEGKIMYILNVTNIGNVTKAEIHVGKQGENGQVVVALFTSKSPQARTNGTLSLGNITSANLQGPMKGKQLSGLIDSAWRCLRKCWHRA
jgi:CHRD domain